MKNLYLCGSVPRRELILIFFLLASVLNAVPQITCEKPVYEFGTKNESETLNHTYMIKNSGDEVLNLGKVRACCGATVNVAKKVLEPGEELPVSFIMKLKGRKGKQDKNIFIASDDPNMPYLNLKIKGTVLRFYKISERFIRLKGLDTDSKISQVVTIIPEKEFPFKITKVESSNDALVARFERVEGLMSENQKKIDKKDSGQPRGMPVQKNVKLANGYEIKIYSKLPLKEGKLSGRVKIYTDNEKFSTITVYLSGKVKSSLQVIPSFISLNQGEGKVSRIVAIRGKSKKFKLLKTDIKDGVKVDMKQRRPGEWICSVDIDRAKLKDSREIVFHTDYPGCEKITVPIKFK